MMRPRIPARATGWGAAALLLAIYACLGLSAARTKTVTFDESLHIAAGMASWKWGFRLETVGLPQRWVALPPVLAGAAAPERPPQGPQERWQRATYPKFLFGQPGDEAHTAADRIVFLARCGTMAAALLLGLLVYAWSRSLFGAAAGTLSLALFAFCPTMLAHGTLATTDLITAALLLASVGALWRLMHRVTWATLGASLAATSLLFLAKYSGPLVVFMVLAMVALRLVNPAPIEVDLRGLPRREIRGRWPRIAGLKVLALAHVAAIVLAIWAAFGFRYAELDPPDASPGREQVDRMWARHTMQRGPVVAAIRFARDRRLLPEAYLLGLAYTLNTSGTRAAFLNGEYREHGWSWFFPYTFLVKTPLPLFGVAALALAAALAAARRAAGAGRRGALRDGFYRTSPLWVLLAVYWGFSVASHLNVGHRHVLVTYPALFILCGPAAAWLAGPRRVPAAALGLLLVWLAGGTLRSWPDYLAYFNELVGGPRNGYKHLVDSSLDWGQDLKGLKSWLHAQGLDRPGPQAQPVYLSYLGTADVKYYGLQLELLPCFFAQELPKPIAPLRPGVYCVSASMLQGVYTLPVQGAWNRVFEEDYQRMRAALDRIVAAGNDPAKLKAAVAASTPDLRRINDRIAALVPDARIPDEQIVNVLAYFPTYRLARLTAYLRSRRSPDHMIGYSILVYRLSDQDLRDALDGPPAQLLDRPQT